MSSATNESSNRFTIRGAAPTGTCLVFIRHGEAACNVNGVVGGMRGCGGLTERGVMQARALRERFVRSRELDDVVKVYSSVLPRARQTAEILRPGLPSHLEPEADCNLCELHPGEADGLTWTDLERRFGGVNWDLEPNRALAPGAESWLGFYGRCERAIGELVTRHHGQRVLLVVHGGVIEQAMKMLAGDAPAVRLGLRTENCSITEIEFDGERRRLLRYNDRVPLVVE